MKVYLTNIHTNKRFPGVVYAEIRECHTDELQVSATMSHCAEILAEIDRKLILCDQAGNPI